MSSTDCSRLDGWSAVSNLPLRRSTPVLPGCSHACSTVFSTLYFAATKPSNRGHPFQRDDIGFLPALSCAQLLVSEMSLFNVEELLRLIFNSIQHLRMFLLHLAFGLSEVGHIFSRSFSSGHGTAPKAGHESRSLQWENCLEAMSVHVFELSDIP